MDVSVSEGDKLEDIIMLIRDYVGCNGLYCPDVDHIGYLMPDIDISTEQISVIMISEAAPQDPADYYYAPGDPLFQKTTVQAFNDAGVNVSSVLDILNRGIYLTTAVKCNKTEYGIKKDTISRCSMILEQELALFPNVQVYLLMGDVAIMSFNYIAQRLGEKQVIPSGSTYKLRGGEYYFQGKRVLPSYLQAGPSFFIEKSKRKMIAEDIEKALNLITCNRLHGIKDP